MPNEQNMSVIRPFCRRCAMVSAPLPVRSRYATVSGSSTAKVSRYPFGDTFTWPPTPASSRQGAVATKNIGWLVMNVLSRSSSSG